jgi:ribbon-helix-helix CopG family protein
MLAPRPGDGTEAGIADMANEQYDAVVKTITVKLPKALASWLSRRARELGRPQSELVREALERSRRGVGGDSCHDLFADVCGTIEGPADLSTNRKHLGGFGE